MIAVLGIYDIQSRMEMMTDTDLLAKVEAFLAQHGMAPSKFGREAMADPALVTHLRNGRSLTLRNAERVVNFMSEYSPSQAAA